MVTLVTLSCDVVPLSVTRLACTGLPSRSQSKAKLVVPTQSSPVQVSVRGSLTLRSGSEGVIPTEGGTEQWIAAGRTERNAVEIQQCLYMQYITLHLHTGTKTFRTYIPSISPPTSRVAVVWCVCVDPSLFLFLPTQVTTAPQSTTVTLWTMTVRVTSMALVGVASVIRVWFPMV